jgi:hypothetical protein
MEIIKLVRSIRMTTLLNIYANVISVYVVSSE